MSPVTTHLPRRAVTAVLTAVLIGPAAALSAAPALATTTVPTTSTSTSTPAASTGTDPSTSTEAPASTSATATVTTAPQRPLAANPTGTAAERAAAYLAANLADGDHVVGAYGTDLGQTADVVLALSSTSAQRSTRDAAAAYLAAHVDDYVHGAAYADGSPGAEKKGANYAGPTGKAIVAALAAGQDPRSFGGFDLVGELQDLMVTSGSKAGRFSDDSAYGDYSNPYGQAFDIIALRRATGDVPAAAVTYLLTAQCADGGFSDTYPASPKACTSNPDATGLALQALVAAGVGDAASDASCAASKALAWLLAHDASNGSYASAAVNPGAPKPNVNSTAYAALGLTAAATATSAQVTYLSGVQNADGGLPIEPTSADHSSNLLATAQALNALTRSTFLSIGTSPVAAAKPACRVTASPTKTSTPTKTRTSKPTTPHGAATGGSSTVAAGAAGRLPRTGADPFGPGLAGLALVVVGGAAIALSRRPRGARQR
jgi:hypothetical protein